jgi:hypothetical protein
MVQNNGALRSEDVTHCPTLACTIPVANAMGLKQSMVDPCLHYKWFERQLVMMMSWIDDNAIVGKESDVMDL